MRVAVCMKWVDTRPEIDSLSGEVAVDSRWFAASPADQSALETALDLATDDDVLVVAAGPAEADVMLRDAIGAGANRAVRVDLDPAADSVAVAAAVAAVLDGVDLVVCGGWSLDRGTGSFPAFLADSLEAAQALGCTEVAFVDGELTAARRLDGGRREILNVPLPAVVSVEAGLRLRRAGLQAVIDASKSPIEVVSPSPLAGSGSQLAATAPYRPRSRELTPPEGDERSRLMQLAGAFSESSATQILRLDPAAAADRLLADLGTWGIGPEAADEAP